MKKHVHFLGFIFLLYSTALISLLRAWGPFASIKESSSQWVSFTGEKIYLEAYVAEEVDKKHRKSHLEASVLQGSNSEGVNIPNLGKILIKIPNYYKVSIGQVCYFEGVVEEPENFSDFDYKQFLNRKGVYMIMENMTFQCSNISARRAGNSIRNFLVDFKGWNIDVIDEVLSEPQSSLLAGILFGQDRLFSESFEENVRVSGVSHIVAASGYNITILVILIDKTLFFLPKKIKITLGLIVVWAFAVLSGLSSSIIRACIMSSVSLLSIFWGRSNTIHISLPLASAVFVFFNPFIVEDVGFLLSISATVGLVYLMPILVDLKDNLTKRLKFIDDYLFPTLSCTISTLPISISTFNTLSLWSVPSNVLILPVLESTMLFGALFILLSNVSRKIAMFFVNIVNVQLKYFELVVNYIGNIPFGSFDLSPFISIWFPRCLVLFVFILCLYFYPVENEKFNYYLRKI